MTTRLFTLILGCSLAGCAGSRPAATVELNAPVEVRYPSWVLAGSGPVAFPGGRAFFGVGSASGISNHALARTTADNRARSEISKSFEYFSSRMMRAYSMGGSPSQPPPGATVYPTSAPEGVLVMERWHHPDGTVYALAILDLESAVAGVKQGGHAARLRRFWLQNGAAIHEEMLWGK